MKARTMIMLALVATAPLLLAVAPEAEAGTTRARTITTSSAQPTVPFKAFDTSVKVFDFNGDGELEIVAQNDNRWVYVFDSSDGRLLAELQTRYPSGWGARSINPPEAAVLQVGQTPHVVVANSAAYVTLFRFDGHAEDGELRFTKVWERRLNDCYGGAGMDSKPVLADLSGDGRLEILGQTEENGVYALRMDGSVYWKRCIAGGNGEPAVADMDFDGVPEVVWASDGGVVTAMNGRTGSTRWTFWAGHPQYNLGAAAMPVGPTIGQIDGHGPLDVAVGARDSHHRTDFSQDHAALFAINGWGGLIWMRQDPDGAPLTYTHPIIHDVDNDGQADILWADWNTIGHKPPDNEADAWKRTGPAHFYRYDAAGDLRWRQTLDTYWQNSDLALADVDDDGVQEVLVNGPGCGGDGIWYLDSRHGTKEACISVHPWKVSRGPVVADLWGHGTMQWVIPVEAATNEVSGGAIMIFDTHVPYDAAWPHLPYPQAGSAPPPPSGNFSADFEPTDTKNNWWVETKVAANRPVVAVSASVDGSGGMPLEKTGWGTWAKSFHVADGSRVVFTARDGEGNVATSQEYVWGDEPEPNPDFDAQFEVPGNVNEWWVEVKVTANAHVTAVSATVDGGSPVALSKTDWGTWAKSFHVPRGSQVVFTATDGTGATDKSQEHTWLGDAGDGGDSGDGGDPGDPGDGELEATFTVPSSVNAWWVEVKVDANHKITGVSAKVDGGSAVALSKTDWGTWAKSFHVPRGSQVVFTATDEHGHKATSQTYTWLGDPDDGGDPGDLEATFTPKGTDNNWWVEVKVDANQALASVDANVDGGSWTALSKTDWGTWAKSFHVPVGSEVRFRATSTSGDTITSGAHTWS